MSHSALVSQLLKVKSQNWVFGPLDFFILSVLLSLSREAHIVTLCHTIYIYILAIHLSGSLFNYISYILWPLVYTMPYNRRIRSRRTRRKSTSWYNRKYSTLQLAQKAWTATKYLKGLVNSEMLHKDTVITLGSNQSNITQIIDITQGDSDSGRTGNSILLRNIYLRGKLEINSSVTGNTRVSLILFKDKQQNADSTPSVTDLLKSNDPDAMLNLSQAGRYKLIWRKTYALNPVSGGRNVVDFHKYWKVYDHVRYNGSASTDIQKNGYYLAIISSEVTNFPSVGINARIGYHDN